MHFLGPVDLEIFLETSRMSPVDSLLHHHLQQARIILELYQTGAQDGTGSDNLFPSCFPGIDSNMRRYTCLSLCNVRLGRLEGEGEERLLRGCAGIDVIDVRWSCSAGLRGLYASALGRQGNHG